MINKKRLIIFTSILLISILGIVAKDKLLQSEDTYILTEENSNDENVEKNKESNIEVEKKEDGITNDKITVYVSGEVKNPGVVTLNEGERLDKAVEKVGGTTKKADLNNINLALKLKDEMHYIIPKKGEKIASVSSQSSQGSYSNDDVNKENDNGESTTSSSSGININTATIEELDKLPGVGEATANKIVNYRDENGNFKSIEDIKNVNGIGDKKFEDMKSLICVN